MSSSDRLLVLLNAANFPPKEYAPGNVFFEAPEADSSDERWNTTVVLKAIKFHGYVGEVTIYYKRTPLNLLGDTVELRSLDQFTDEGIMQQLNNLLGTELTTDDLEPIDIPELQLDETEPVVVTAKSASLGWIGAITISLTHGRAELAAIIGQRLLNVLNHPSQVALNGLPYAKNLTRGFDFTSYRDACAATGSYPTNVPALQNVTKKLGLPDWVSGTVTDNATTDVADSNKSFDRVAIVQCTSSGMVGPLYFHYNKFD